MIMYYPENTWDIFASHSEAIVNPVNCEGAMGKGLALQFKNKIPGLNDFYIESCKNKTLEVGKPLLYFIPENEQGLYLNNNVKYVVLFPTKDKWRNPSLLSYISHGMEYLCTKIKEHRITSISIPHLGCGLGGLDWEDVYKIIYTSNYKYGINELCTIYLYQYKGRM